MKLLRSLSILTAIAVIVPSATFAAEKKAPKKEGAAPAAETKKPAAEGKKPADPTKPISMNARVDSLDASAKTFTHKTKDGKEVKHVVTDKTDIKNGAAAAKFEDIKLGDMVAGSRIKKSDTEYEVVKITKFGAAAPKAPKEGAKKPAAEGDKKPAEKKTDAKKE